MKTRKAKTLSVAIGAAVLANGVLPMAIASTNLFSVAELETPYQLAAAEHEAKCGEGKCGGEKSSEEGKCGEGRCGSDKSGEEGKCGEGKCGSDKSEEEGKCGEGKCGGAA